MHHINSAVELDPLTCLPLPHFFVEVTLKSFCFLASFVFIIGVSLQIWNCITEINVEIILMSSQPASANAGKVAYIILHKQTFQSILQQAVSPTEYSN